jgi:predicted RNase H-like nuclease (RuvC/YqgF family)
MAEPTRDDSGRFAKDLSNQARLMKEIEQTQSRINALKQNLIEGDKEQEKLIKSQTAYLNKLYKINV